MGFTKPGAGELRERIAVQRVTNTRDSMGGVIQTWSTVYTLWASVQPMSAGEQFRRQQIQAAADWKIIVRFKNAITITDRIVWRGRTFQISALSNDDLQTRFTTIACKELEVADTEFTTYVPMLDFSEARNSQYIGQVV